MKVKFRRLEVHAVQLKKGVNLNAALSGEALLEQPTPEWIDQAASKGVLTISKQPKSQETYLFIDQPEGSFLVSPGDWIVQMPEGYLVCIKENAFDTLFEILHVRLLFAAPFLAGHPYSSAPNNPDPFH